MAFKETIEMNSSSEDAQEKKEEEFWKHLDALTDSGNVTVLENIGGREYDNKFSLDFKGIVTALRQGNDAQTELRTLDNFAEVLKAAHIKKAAEVGAGTPYSSMIQKLAPAFNTAGIQLFSIGDSSGKYDPEFEKDGIRVIPEEAGDLPEEKLDLDLVIAHNVFSLGGQFTAGRDYKDSDEPIHWVTIGVLDLVKHLSDNPQATIVLSEAYDIMPLDREAIAKEVNILCWHKMHTSGGWIYRAEIMYDDELTKRVYRDAPNFVVLQKKSTKNSESN